MCCVVHTSSRQKTELVRRASAIEEARFAKRFLVGVLHPKLLDKTGLLESVVHDVCRICLRFPVAHIAIPSLLSALSFAGAGDRVPVSKVRR